MSREDANTSFSLPLVTLASPYRIDDQIDNHASLRRPYQSFPGSLGQSFLKLIKLGTESEGRVHDVAVEVVGGELKVTLIKRPQSEFVPTGLCASCSRIPLSGLANEEPRTFLLQLDRTLRNKDWCRICRILFRALCHHAYDPLRDPSVQNHIQDKFKGMPFEQWASTAVSGDLRSPDIWPFGRYTARRPDGRGGIGAAPTAASVGIISDKDRNNVLANVDHMVAQQMGYGGRGQTVKWWTQYRAEHVDDPYVQRRADREIETAEDNFRQEDIALPCWVCLRVERDETSAEVHMLVDINTYARQPQPVPGIHPLQDAAGPLQCVSQFTLRVVETAISGGSREAQDEQNSRIRTAVGQHSLNECVATHGPLCDQPLWASGIAWQKGEKFSIRVVDVLSETLVDLHSLKGRRYACLSYVWGSAATQTALLTKNRLQSYQTVGGMSSSNVSTPQTIRDAMALITAIGERYLWVDSLCIIQDDDEDKKTQITQMHRIFGNATLTIVAADSIHSNAGINGISIERPDQSISQMIREGISIECPLIHHLNIEQSPWNKRAWTLQERFLSKRLLICSGGYLSFHCNQGFTHENAAEISTAFRPPRLDWLRLTSKTKSTIRCAGWPGGEKYILSASSFFNEYALLVEQYSKRQTSYGSDALNAIHGLLSVLYSTSEKPQSIGPFLHGIPQNFVDLALLWQPAEGSAIRLRRRTESNVPSWSWAAWTAVPADAGHTFEGGVRYERSIDQDDGRKILDSTAKQRIKPLLSWHLCRSTQIDSGETRKQLIPINGSGIGLPLVTEFSNDIKARDKILQRVQERRVDDGEITEKVLDLLDERHLIMKTGCARFPLASAARPRTETLWNDRRGRKDLVADFELILMETSIFSCHGNRNEIGRIMLPGPIEELQKAHADAGDRGEQEQLFDFIVISEALPFGDKSRKSKAPEEFSMYNVMLIQWANEELGFARRVALGRIKKTAWDAANSEQRIVILE